MEASLPGLGRMAERDGKPEPIGDAVAGFLKARGLDARVHRSAILFDWAGIVGPQIAAVTAAQRVTDDGVLFIAVKTHAWMNELSLMEAQLLARINAREGHAPLRKIRWELLR